MYTWQKWKQKHFELLRSFTRYKLFTKHAELCRISCMHILFSILNEQLIEIVKMLNKQLQTVINVSKWSTYSWYMLKYCISVRKKGKQNWIFSVKDHECLHYLWTFYLDSSLRKITLQWHTQVVCTKTQTYKT